MIRLMARERQIARLPAAVLCLLLLFAPAGLAATDLDTDEAIMVNNVWIDVPLTQVLRDISIETGVVIAIGPQVPDILVSLDAGLGKPLQECLRELVAGQGIFIHQRSKGFYIISSGNPSSPAFMEVASSKRLYLKYITARHLQASLPRPLQQYVSSGERTNESLICAVPEIMKRIMEIVTKLDVPRRQVVLEVLVVDLWEDASDEFGFNWEFIDHDSSIAMSGLGGFAGVASFTSISASKLAELTLTLKALVAEKRASIRSRPRVATLNGQKASIDISLDEYFAITTDLYGDTSRLRTQLQIIKSGVLLEMTPHIGDDGDITIDIHTTVSDVASRRNNPTNDSSVSYGNLPVIRRREAKTRVRAKEGDAIVIGGLVETQERTDDKKVPILSSIPLIGGLFTSKESTTVKKVVMIFITPRLIREGQIALSDRNKLINKESEIELLRDVATLFDVRYKRRQNLLSEEEEIQCLRDVVAVLNGQRQHRQDSLKTDDEGEIPSSGRYNSFNITEEIESLRDVVALLNVESHNTHGSLDVDKEHESSVKNE